LLPSRPGGVQQELVAQDLPRAKIGKKLNFLHQILQVLTKGLKINRKVLLFSPHACGI